MSKELSLGYSPCPNDTYIFYALVHGLIPLEHVYFSAPVLDDVETLNNWSLQSKLDITKMSFHALGHVLDKYVMLSSGAALGRGCGPLLVARPGVSLDFSGSLIAIPGSYTTAALLLKLYQPETANLKVMRFEDIMPAVAAGEVDAGAIIHESRFTYQDMGLIAIEDLGQWWEDQSGLPIPLGCIAARRSLENKIIIEVDRAIRSSLEWTRNNPEQCMGYVRKHSQEMQDNVLKDHISLYVNDFSLQLGNEGKAAVMELFRRGSEAGIFPEINESQLLVA